MVRMLACILRFTTARSVVWAEDVYMPTSRIPATYDHEMASPAGMLAAGVWQHVALSYDKASGSAVIYYEWRSGDAGKPRQL